MTASGARLPDWLVIGQEEWDEVERRNQLLIRALAERHPRSRFLFAELPLRPSEIKRWRLPRVEQVGPNIWTVRAIRPLPGRALQRVSDRIECMQVRRAARELGMERPMLWTQDPRTADLLDELPSDRVLYDLTDDWAAFESDPLRREQVQRCVDRLCARAELVLACSRPLEHGARQASAHVLYLPNAVDPPSDGGESPGDLSALPRPRLGYVGTLHSSRLDVDLLARAAELRASWSFVLLGSDELREADRERLLSLPNVHYLGVRPHAAVRSYLTGLDVCLVPHRINEFTRSLDPLKIYEYLAAGRPVVATPVGNTPALEQHVACAATSEQLVAECEHAIAQDTPARASTRRSAVADATWEARARKIEVALKIATESPRTAAISVVIVSHNTRELLKRCLTDLCAQTEVEQQVIVVDNASTDGSIELVRERFPDVQLIELEENAGFGRANNLAFEHCCGEYVLLLNSDAFLAPGALAEMVSVARRHPRAAAIGPRLLNSDGTLQRSAWPFPNAGRLLLEAVALHRPLRSLGLLEDLGTWAHDCERTVDFLIGACLLLRADALAEVGGFDEGFWLYGEEADLQRRLASRGWQVIFTPTATTTHVGGASSQVSTTRLRHLCSGQKRFLTKHGSVLAWPAAWLAFLVGSAVRRRWSGVRVALGMRD